MYSPSMGLLFQCHARLTICLEENFEINFSVKPSQTEWWLWRRCQRLHSAGAWLDWLVQKVES